ncbi:hypothetical protein [Catellatospora tritici]|uniref:hypothetical protein n=1 Tax=Catellatospora tritici TaxID=2851566 RepID=UPI001C2CD044|nr:hypothetical protein [Catellatospora tritici]MBV1853773.1 hypothetical protein [Catellatospora tritici]
MGRYATARGWIQLDPDQRGAAEAIGLMLISPEEQDAYWWEIRDGLVLRRTAPATAWIDE